MEQYENSTPVIQDQPPVPEAPVPAPAPAVEKEPDTLVKFPKPYTFEGITYTEIDLSGLDNLTSEDMIAAEKFLNRSGLITPMPEVSAEYTCFIAAKASGMPVEFFRQLPPKAMIRVKNKVTGFFYGEE